MSDGLGIIDETYQTLAYIRANNLSNIQSFGQKFPNGTRQYDLFFGAGKFTELKNANFVGMTSLPSQYVDQVIEGYFANINSLDDFNWVACELKLKANGWDKATAETKLKELWKQALLNKSDLLFKSLEEGGLGLVKIKQLFGNDIDDVSDFIDALNESNSKVLDFVKVE